MVRFASKYIFKLYGWQGPDGSPFEMFSLYYFVIFINYVKV